MEKTKFTDMTKGTIGMQM